MLYIVTQFDIFFILDTFFEYVQKFCVVTHFENSKILLRHFRGRHHFQQCQLDHKVLLDHKDHQAKQALQEYKDHLDQWVPQDLKVP